MLVNLQYTILIFLFIGMASTQHSPFQVQGTRNRQNTNLLTMRCISSVETTGEAYFFLNGTNLEERDDVNVVRSEESIVFLLRQDLEGSYTCKRWTNNSYTQSLPVQFVVYPSSQIIPTSHTIFAEYGTTAVLDCSLSPGRLIKQYYATWRNGTSKNVYAKISRPYFTSNQPTTMPSNTRYSVDPSTLALIISDVVLTDSDTRYRCEVGVEEPQNGNIAFIFTATASTDIILVVYKHPLITVPPSPAIVSLSETQQARYQCTAVGDPAPQITWTHNGHATTLQTMYHTSTSIPEIDSDGRGFIVTGTLVIFPLMEERSGNVICTAGITPSDMSTIGEEVPEDMHETSLSVLGGFRNMDVFITQDGDVIFKLNLPALINTPVHLFLTYEDATHEKDKKQGGPPYKMNRTTTISYNNTKTIIYIEFKSQLPFHVFRVGVALFSKPILGFDNSSCGELDLVDNSSMGTYIGPTSYWVEAGRSKLQYLHSNTDVNQPTLMPTRLMKIQFFLAAIIPILFFLLLFITITIITCKVLSVQRRKAKLDFQETVVRKLKDVLQILSERLPDNPSETIYMKLLEFTERILTNSAHYYENPPCTIDEEVDCDGKHELDKSEEVRVDMEEFELLSSKRKSSALLQTLKNVIETSMQNPKLCGHLQQISGLIGNSAPNQKTFKRALSESEPLGNGRSRSNSMFSKVR